ncbi:MAG: UDP-N-acetylmuramate--L-alanine ligase [Nitrospinae bacterium RIFCSPLOWO2_12_39_16]|nr:MAG: UDP-N-acetylmuramate--L-alanine ligase [Nitrospinae bacterium RIFCSPLOWO2_12_39_16]HLA47800.1 UDP-N-acetylmuramate--L-alanine ligase [Nitrospinota bacterium]
MFRKTRHIHFVGIGGSGMSGIAEVLLNLGYKVSGSDLSQSEAVKRLTGIGAAVFMGHKASNVNGAEVVVVSSAVSPDNEEVVVAKKKLIPVIPRAEMLAELMRLKYSIAVAGAHGKTTTTSMVSSVLYAGGLDPTVVIGGRVNSIGSGAKLGQGDFLVAEADESDGSFLKLTPTIAVVTTIDAEHLDHYGDMEEIKKAFLKFINKVPFYGSSVLCLDQEHIQSIIPHVEKRFITYGFSSQAEYNAGNIKFSGRTTMFTALRRQKILGEIKLNIPGMHNIYNSMAAIAVGLELDMDFGSIKRGLEEFSGVQRRFQVKGEADGVMVVDDYGHHPAEIKATLKAARDGWKDKRLITVFQPHRYTRTRDLLKDFYTAFYDSDSLIITDIYPAGEKPIDGINAKLIYEGVRGHGHRDVVFIGDKEEIAPYLSKKVKEGDIVITLGAGDVWKIGEEFLHGKL